ncbi:hypothetical protein [Daejeonella lutea]|uniref:Uncharacterized protein n=1 Tax=Daejeonella lutea TaxID=572036 RepID=A0A1T5AZ66_9SPHI|nr:hypothetical protein [Daejeonella lutea]SKB40119.1 hypothetical protein SAMN05661099_1138 [Daejeonella lutea]
MKNLKKRIVEFMVVAIGLSACGVGKFLTKNSTRNTERREVEMSSHVSKDEASFAERGILFSDSSQHDYRVIIFPRDSFSYIFQDGFRGTAHRVEISGSAARVVDGKYYQIDSENTTLDSSQSSSETSKNNTRVVSKEITTRSSVVLIVLAVVIICIVICLGWRQRQGSRQW